MAERDVECEGDLLLVITELCGMLNEEEELIEVILLESTILSFICCCCRSAISVVVPAREECVAARTEAGEC